MEDKNMKTKYLAILPIFALALLSACNKDSRESVSAPAESRILATIDDAATKTDYVGETGFQWVEGDRILLLVNNVETNAADHYSHYATASGPSVTFSGTSPTAGYDAIGYCLYPGLVHGGNPADGFTVTLPGNYEYNPDYPMSVIPMIGKVDAQNPAAYHFLTATGVLKLTLANLSPTARKVRLEAVGAPLSGTYVLDDITYSSGVRMERTTGDNEQKVSVSFPSQANGSTLVVYMPVPAGTIPSGAEFVILDGADGELYRTAPTVVNMEIERNQLLTITRPIQMPDVTVYSLDDVLGVYDMTVTAHGYSTNNRAGDIVLEQSDDASRGNVMMTRFGGIAGKQYGTFDGLTVTFPKDQIFGVNPYSGVGEYPYVALDFFNGGVVDAVLQVNGRGSIEAVGIEAAGLRATTAELWAEYNGGWPWALGYGSITAEWKTPYVKGSRIELHPGMVIPSDVCSHDGSWAGLLDGDPNTFWHSNWYYPIQKNDPEYGIYFDITLDFPIDACIFKYQTRADGNNNTKPVKVVYGVSADGVNWTKVGEESNDTMLNAALGEVVELSKVSLGGSYKYIRFGIADSNSVDAGELTGDLSFTDYKKCACISELTLIWAE